MKSSIKKTGNKFAPLKATLALLLTVTALWANPHRVLKIGDRGSLSFRTNEVIVKYKKHISAFAAMNNSQQAFGSTTVRALMHTPAGEGPTHLIKALRSKSVDEAIADFANNPDVEFAQPNYIYHATAVPNDPQYGQLWGLKNSAQSITSPIYTTNNPGTTGRDINAETAWNTITNCSSVVVAVVDSGVNYTHEDLAANMVSGSYTCPGGTGTRGCDFVGTGDNNPMDVNGHGTHVAGTIGAVGNNGTGTTGVCWTAQILAVRVLDASASGTTADIVEGLNFAAGTSAGQGNAKVINMSLGGPSFDTAFNNALTTAQNNGAVVVVAAGNATQNHNTTPSYPCDYAQSNIICVAAVDQSYAIATFSDFDTNATAANRKVDIAAPGTNIRSAYFGTTTTINDTFNTSGSLNWTLAGDGGWAYSTCSGNLPASLITPPGWCAGTIPGNFINNRAYKNFNLSGYSAAVVNFVAWVDLKQTGDHWAVFASSTGGDPWLFGTTLIDVTGVLNMTTAEPLSFDISACNTAACTIGFQYQTDFNNNVADDGVLVSSFSISGQSVTTNAYQLENGTSMAAPHVAGIAALIRARNPSYTVTDTVNAILEGGDAIAGLAANTKSGRVADANGSLLYIPDTTGLALVSP